MKNTMKKIGLLFSIVLVIMMFAFSASAETEGGYTYSVSNGVATITDVSSSVKGDIIIPSSLGGYDVTKIGENLFYGNTNITSLTIPDSVVDIKDWAFANCTNIKTIVFGEGVKFIGEAAFAGCDSLERVEIPDSTLTLDVDAFYGCDNLSSVTIGNGVTKIGTDAFSYCEKLTSVTIGASLKTLSSKVFQNCDALSDIFVSEYNESFSSFDGVLYNKDKTSISIVPNAKTVLNLPESLESFSVYSVDNCKNLVSIMAENNENFSSIEGVLYSCDKNTLICCPSGIEGSIDIYNQTKTIGNQAFYGCCKITELRIPESVMDICANAFKNCTLLENVFIDKSVQHIGWNVFSSCSKLSNIYYNGSSKEFYRLKGSSPKMGLSSTVNIVFSENSVTTEYEKDDFIVFGSYPQTIIRDIELLNELNKIQFEWNETDSKTYSDIEYLGNKYRAVLNSNGVAWYKFEPIVWRVVNQYSGLVLSEYILDKQKYDDSDNDYVNSYIKEWLNNDFYNASFNEGQQEKIVSLAREHENYSDRPTYNYLGYSVENIFLISSTELGVSYTYPFSYYTTESTAYANTGKDWWLRTPCYGRDGAVFYMHNEMFRSSQPETVETELGIRPAMYLELEKVTCEHSYSKRITAPTCTDKGYTKYICPCGDTYISDYTDEIEHKYTSEITIPATHIKEGVETFTCECGDSYTKSVAKLEGHIYTSKITTEATHTKEGVRTYTCECGDSYTETITKLEGHTYTSKITTEATHTKEGIRTFTCECGDSYTEAITKLTEHTYTSTVTKQPTHIAEGTRTFTCACGDSYTEFIEKTKEHKYIVTSIVAPTCEKEGYTVYTCQCGDSYNSDVISANGHSYNGDICKVCGESKVSNCDCNCHKDGFMGFIWKIIRVFYKIFGMNKTCACGIAHY